MKLLKSLIAILAITTLTSCNKVEKPTEKETPAITLQAKGSTTSSISFEITPSNGEECAYMILTNQEIPTAQEILSNGVEVPATETSTQPNSDLAEDTF